MKTFTNGILKLMVGIPLAILCVAFLIIAFLIGVAEFIVATVS